MPTVLFKAKSPLDMSPSGQTIIFTETLYNYGDGYNNSTGVFTAPFAGTNLFTGHLCSTINKYIPSGIEVDGKDVSRTLGYGKEYISWTNFDAIVMVERSSSVLIKSYYSRDQLTGSDSIWNTFTGVLLHIWHLVWTLHRLQPAVVIETCNVVLFLL